MDASISKQIIARVERVRVHLGLNKSRFSSEIGMKPQTYSNFIGAQGSKPNVELIHGLVTRWLVDPLWLLTGVGTMFQSWTHRRGVNESGTGQTATEFVVAGRPTTLMALEARVAAIETELRAKGWMKPAPTAEGRPCLS